jgi:hypothetical protein
VRAESEMERFDEDWMFEDFRTSCSGMLLFNMCCTPMRVPRAKLKHRGRVNRSHEQGGRRAMQSRAPPPLQKTIEWWVLWGVGWRIAARCVWVCGRKSSGNVEQQQDDRETIYY